MSRKSRQIIGLVVVLLLGVVLVVVLTRGSNEPELEDAVQEQADRMFDDDPQLQTPPGERVGGRGAQQPGG